MQTIDARNQLYLRGRKIALACLLIFGLAQESIAQVNPTYNLPTYERSWLHYGFLFGVHSSKYVIRYSEHFTSPAMDDVHSIVPGNLPGFKLGFVVNMKVARNLDFRMLPSIGFYEYNLDYRYTTGDSKKELKDATMIELPILFKYKSVRRENLAMYMIFGVKPSLEASGKGDEEDKTERLELRNWDLAIEVGVGLDIFYPFFKFSPELRYSYGLRNMLTDDPNQFSIGLEKLTNQNITLLFTFEGGPDKSKKLKKKTKGAGKMKKK